MRLWRLLRLFAKDFVVICYLWMASGVVGGKGYFCAGCLVGS